MQSYGIRNLIEPTNPFRSICYLLSPILYIYFLITLYDFIPGVFHFSLGLEVIGFDLIIHIFY